MSDLTLKICKNHVRRLLYEYERLMDYTHTLEEEAEKKVALIQSVMEICHAGVHDAP